MKPDIRHHWTCHGDCYRYGIASDRCRAHDEGSKAGDAEGEARAVREIVAALKEWAREFGWVQSREIIGRVERGDYKAVEE